jgi:hypothetical protein
MKAGRTSSDMRPFARSGSNANHREPGRQKDAPAPTQRRSNVPASRFVISGERVPLLDKTALSPRATGEQKEPDCAISNHLRRPLRPMRSYP